ncbi:MAG TPA: DedA family protein [Patescibacteria group bacterium]|nr:DedA family protein [Patescibacteria group bacterium]
MSAILSAVSHFIIEVVSRAGYAGVAGLMAIESANIPLPSEVIMPFAGYLVFLGKLNLWWTGFFGAVGCLVGSVLSYWLGYWGGRPLIEKYGKYVLISRHDLNLADKWFRRFGEEIVFVGRLLPIIRTYISFPAGIAKMNFAKFSLYSFLGSLPWCLFLAWLGLKLGENWEKLRTYFHGLDWVIGVLILIGIIWWIWRHIRQSKK